ncbi:N-methyl-L-tryptophan oxidase [Brevibacillus nitrificans]|uniref:N-methyl-L-tryptophan oxidase n=1 Tax=Brevibacillus nitrificans TaxID=651560 RepID=UPI00285FAA0D|nr:N-methyl-L-tryptophan oxidase [Brevibacillus nitrificans]MDR7315428.1 sarcosine oxidase/N-methyl-L-tryptophan oxidase [Brevibacillus nitrificans]
MENYEVIIVGAGSMGMAAGYYLAKQGVRTLLLDSYDPPHTMGSHHGDTRIIRHAYGEGKQYVPLALRAQQLWRELETVSGTKLFEQTGVLSAGPLADSFLQEIRESAETYSLPLEVLRASEVNERWPGISLPDHFYACLETSSGVLYSEKCITAYREQAIAAGATLLTHTPVTAIQPDGDGVIVHTEAHTYRAGQLLLSAGAWNPALLASLDLSLPLSPTRKTVAWFGSEEDLYRADKFPAFIFKLADETSYYGFPSIDQAGVKIGRHDGGVEIDPDRLERTFGAFLSDEGDVRSFLETYMPQAAGALRQGRVCIYTMTPDEHFIIDRHPEHSQIVIAAGFSGHGFKFASAVGEAASELLTQGKSTYDLSMFSLQRF